MDSENQTVQSDAITVKSSRPSRRIKTQLPTDKDQENLQNFSLDSPQIDEFKCAMDESKINTSDHIANSSTPRRKKDPLSNLYSNLSPKYIGFGTINSNSDNGSEDRPRAARRRRRQFRRNNAIANDTDTSRDSSVELDEAVSLDLSFTFGYVRRTEADGPNSQCSTPKNRAIKINEFVSPIDKLLKKNGSLAENSHTLPLTDADKREKFNNAAVPHEKEQEWAVPIEEQNNNNIAKIKDEQQLEKEEDYFQAKNSSTTDDAEETKEYTPNKTSQDKLDPMESTDIDEEKISTENAAIPENNSSRRNSKEENSSKNDLQSSTNRNVIDNVNEKDDWKIQTYNLQASKVPAESTIEHKTEQNDRAVKEEFKMNNSTAISASAIMDMDSTTWTGSSIENEASLTAFITGDLCWGQIYNFCYWPCMVYPDPDEDIITKKEYNSSGDQCTMVHVRFFADKGRRNWVKRENLMPYTSLQAYQDRLDEVREKYGTKSIKFMHLVPRKNRTSVWRTAVEEMEKVASVPHEKRMDMFMEIFEIAKAELKLRRKSMNLANVNHISSSELENVYASNENINLKSITNLKRERSVSPFSPAFSPIKSIMNKKRKLSEENVEHLLTMDHNLTNNNEHRRHSHSSGISATSNVLDMYHSVEFENFHAVMKEFVLENNHNHDLENSLFAAVRNIWALKELSREKLEMERKNSTSKVDEKEYINKNISSTTDVGGDVKRLSHVLKRISARNSMSSQRLTPFFGDLSHEPASVADMVATIKVETPTDASIHPAEKTKRGLIVNRPILQVIDDIFQLDSKYLFKGMTRDPVCKYCYKAGGNLSKCSKNCNSWLHSSCLNTDIKANNKRKRKRKRLNSAKVPAASPTPETLHVTSETAIEDKDVICKECANHEPATCMVCNLTDSVKTGDTLVNCNITQCSRSFHPGCCKLWPQAILTASKNNSGSFRCPSHVCHTCVSDDPKAKFQHIANTKLIKCIKCPATYHTDSTCIPAGSQILTSAHLICPRHSYLKTDSTVNVNWCFFCVQGGQVVCCETCPTAIHAQCLKVPIDENAGYICEECESGRLPLYGELVWAKFNNFRWWPAIILPPTEIPHNIAKKPRNPSDFVVRFFGTHDHGWISRRRVYLYLEGDTTEPPRSNSNIDRNYLQGVSEAKEICQIIKAKKLEQRISKESRVKIHPQPYIRIKANRAVPPVKLHIDMESVSKCDCNPNVANPCGADSNCLNRVLYNECNPKVCPAGERCQNQRFESRISPSMDVVYVKERGFGLFSREPIAAGTFVIEYVGEIINDKEFRARMSQKSMNRDENFYFLSVEKDYIIDAGPKGNLARFMNHSCDPNCEAQKWSVNSLNRVGLFAIKDIPENTELTFNYHWDDLLDNEKAICYCGSKNCAGHIGKIKRSSKESSPSDDSSLKLKSKTKSTRKSKVKPLKRLASKTSTTSKPKRTRKRKTNKIIAAAALATINKLDADNNGSD